MTLPLELGGIHDPVVRRAFEALAQQFPVVAAGGGGGAPSGAAGGVLGGTYPNPGFAVDMATQAELDAHATLTTTAHGGIVASTDPRLTDARTPTAHHVTHEPGGTDAMAVDAAATTGSLRTLGTGALQATAGNDARLTNARAPTAHQATHQSGGTDALTGLLDANARLAASKAGTLVGTRRGLNLIEGSNVTLTVADNAASERVDVTIAAAAGGGGTTTQTGAFSAYRAAASSLTSGSTVVFDTEEYDVSSWFDPATGRFTPQTAGVYSFAWCVRSSAVLTSDVVWIASLAKNGTIVKNGEVSFQRPGSATDSVGSARLQANGTTDFFTVVLSHTVGAAQGIAADSINTFFQGEFASSITGTITDTFVTRAKWMVD